MWVDSYKTLSPDSCIWLLADDHFDPKKRHALYLEDFVDSLRQVKDSVHTHTNGKNIQLLPVLLPIPFNLASPVAASTVYKPPEEGDFMTYAAPHGIYFAFLASYESSDG